MDKPCPDCESRKHYILGAVMCLTLFLTAIVIFDYLYKASSIEAYNNLSKECNRAIDSISRSCHTKCPSQANQTFIYPIMYNMNCSYGGG